MRHPLIDIIQTDDPDRRDTPLEVVCGELDRGAMLEACAVLDKFRRHCDNLYHRVRALFFLYAIYRFYLPPLLSDDKPGALPFEGHQQLLKRRFREAINQFLEFGNRGEITDSLSSALAESYYQLGLQNLADQVRSSVRAVRGNQWMFRMGHPADHPLRIRSELIPEGAGKEVLYPIIEEKTAVRMDLSHSGWSDIFFLGMDFPEGARVLNISIDLTVDTEDSDPKPPIEVYIRVIRKAVIRLASIDLEGSVEIEELSDVFDFAKDYLGLLKAAIIAAGIVPIGLEGSGQKLSDLLDRLVGPGLGLELVSSVNNIPKGSRLAVSTNLLSALIAVCMRATGQTDSLERVLAENERRLIAARAILGEWLGGSGGGWQDSGGIWPGVKIISGCPATKNDPEYGISRGRLLPAHQLVDTSEISEETRRKLQESLVLVHGGMAQNVGPILEMVTEKYLLRSGSEWRARQRSSVLFDGILSALKKGDIKELGKLTTEHFFGPLQSIIPWVSNRFTEHLIDHARAAFGENFWGFWMLGGMSGGGMGFIFDPNHMVRARQKMGEIMAEAKKQFEDAIPFAMNPVVYSFAINDRGTHATLKENREALMPPAYYPLMMPGILRRDLRNLSPGQSLELKIFKARAAREVPMRKSLNRLVEKMLPVETVDSRKTNQLDQLLTRYGFDPIQHEKIRSDLKSGLIGLSQNRLPANSHIEDVSAGDVLDATLKAEATVQRIGRAAIEGGEVALVTLAAGAGSRWTAGAGVVKALNPFCRFGGTHRNFLEVHFAKTRKTARKYNHSPAHVITTGYLTHEPIKRFIERHDTGSGFQRPILSFGSSIGLRLIPTLRDLRFAWEQTAHQLLDERAQKVRESLQQALMAWAKNCGEASDYRDNLPVQCLHPVGHWFEIPNLLLNGTLNEMLQAQPGLKTLYLHNIDTMGTNLDPGILGLHLKSGKNLNFEVISRRLLDRGGGLARVNGKLRLVEGLALPREEDEFKLSYYNTLSTWIEIDPLLQVFGLNRDKLGDRAGVARAVRTFANRLPTYITLKDVKKRWGHGQEDIYPVCQFEKLWGDMTAIPEIDSGFIRVSRFRGQQLKEPEQLDGWLRDGSFQFVEDLCEWG